MLAKIETTHLTAWLAVKNLFFTVLIPGSVTITVPYFILRDNGPILHGAWMLHNYLSLAPISFGAAILFRCVWDFAVAGRGTLAPVDPPKQLVVRGLYRYVRNPMYVGVLSILLGEALLFWSRALLGYAGIIFGIVNVFVLFYEEPVLRRQFGKSYEAYRRRVNRWLPALPRDEVG